MVTQILQNSKSSNDGDAGFYAITTQDKFNTMIMKGRLRVKFGDAGQKIKGEGSIDKRLGQYVNALALKSDQVEIGRWVNPIGINARNKFNRFPAVFIHIPPDQDAIRILQVFHRSPLGKKFRIGYDLVVVAIG